MKNRTIIFLGIVLVILIMPVLYYTNSYINHPDKESYYITSAALSPDARIVVVVYQKQGGAASSIGLYDRIAKSFRLLPHNEPGLMLAEPSFSTDRKSIVVSAWCYENCPNPNDRSRILIFDMELDEWRVVVAGPGYRQDPVFSGDNSEILYVFARFRYDQTGRLWSPVEPGIAVFEIKTGTERILPIRQEFYSIYNPSVSPEGVYYFQAIGPRSDRLVEEVRKLGTVVAEDVVPLVYRFDPRAEENGTSLVALANNFNFNALVGGGGVWNFAPSSDASFAALSTSSSESNGAIQESIYISNGPRKSKIYETRTNIKGIDISSDGKKIMFVGDPTRSGNINGPWDVFCIGR